LQYCFEDYVLDAERRELHRNGDQIPIEPQVFDLLLYLLRNRDRAVSKDDVLAAVWGGRLVSESALTSRINAARHAVGDDGRAQRLIRTLRGRGFRFIGPVREHDDQRGSASEPRFLSSPACGSSNDEQFFCTPKDLEGRRMERTIPPQFAADSEFGTAHETIHTLGATRRASIAVMPFDDKSHALRIRGGTADGLAHDVITRLAKLRSLFVIAQGTVFALHERNIGSRDAGQLLNVDYVVGGSLHLDGKRLTVSVELVESRTARIVWAEVFSRKLDDAFLVLDEIGNRIVASIANEIETIERNRAILRPPNSLDAWEAHHRGLWHMYRFNRADNEKAQHFFTTAVHLDPTFARAYAGLSFTHWQNAFQGWTERKREEQLALDAAGQSLMADDRDPAAHWAMGRALWLRGGQDQALSELEQAINLSPNFALGHYTLAFVHSQAGDPAAAVRFSDHSRDLSPFDPLLFAMFGARAMALLRLKRFEEAADWGVKAAARPNAHPHIFAIAAYSLAMAGRLEEAHVQFAAVRDRSPAYSVDDFLTAMRFSPQDSALFRKAATKLRA
jgi:TolB-like protein/DNA-binding winged helix-turn-helix (wHTH) protein